jgi:hypothetical protein
LWVAERLAWLPVFAAMLAVLWAVFHRAERAPRGKRPAPAGGKRQRPAQPVEHSQTHTGPTAETRAIVTGRRGSVPVGDIGAARF